MTEPSCVANSTGMQSATWIAHTRPACTRDRGVGARRGNARSGRDRGQRRRAVNLLEPDRLGWQLTVPRARGVRFSATAAGSSPTCVPRFSDVVRRRRSRRPCAAVTRRRAPAGRCAPVRRDVLDAVSRCHSRLRDRGCRGSFASARAPRAAVMSGGSGASHSSVLPVIGCSSASRVACRAWRLKSLQRGDQRLRRAARNAPARPPYTGSPTSGKPMCARCTRI